MQSSQQKSPQQESPFGRDRWLRTRQCESEPLSRVMVGPYRETVNAIADPRPPIWSSRVGLTRLSLFVLQVVDMRKREQQDEKLMYEIAQENKRMSEPLRKARQVNERSADDRDQN